MKPIPLSTFPRTDGRGESHAIGRTDYLAIQVSKARDQPLELRTCQASRGHREHDNVGGRPAGDDPCGGEDGAGRGHPAAAEDGGEVCGDGADAEGDAHLDGGDEGGGAPVGLEGLHDLAQEDAERELDPPY